MAKTKKLSRVIAFVLTLVMMLTIVPFQGLAAEAADPTAVELQNGKVALSADMTDDEVKIALFNALVANPEGKDPLDYEWEFYDNGYDKSWGWWEMAWGSIKGFTHVTRVALTDHYYDHGRLASNSKEGNWQVRLAGATKEATLTKVNTCNVNFEYEKTQGQIYGADTKPLADNLTGMSPKAGILFTIVPVTGYEVASVTVNGKELAAVDGKYNFVPVADTTVEVTFYRLADRLSTLTLTETEGVSYKVNGFNAEGTFDVAKAEEATVEIKTAEGVSIEKVLVNGNDVTKDVEFNEYNGTYKATFSSNATISVATTESAIKLTDNKKIPVYKDENDNWNYADMEQGVIDTLIADGTIPADFTKEEIEITYNCEPYRSSFTKYVPLNYTPGGINVGFEWSFWDLFYYSGAGKPAPHEAQLRLQFKGNDQYRPSEYVYVTVTLNELPTATIVIRSGVQEFELAETATGGVYNYEALRQAIYEAVIDAEHSSPEGAVTYDNIKFTYKILDATGLTSYGFYNFEDVNVAGDVAGWHHYMYKGGQFTIKAELPSTESYYGTSVEFDVKVTPVKLPSAEIAVKDGYNKNFVLTQNYDGSFNYGVFEDALYNEVVDAAASKYVTRENIKFAYDIKADGTYTVKAYVDSAETYYGTEVTFDVVVDVTNKFETEIVIDENATNFTLTENGIDTYDYDALKDQILNAVTVKGLPEGVKLTADDFTVEYKLYNAMGTTDSWSGHFRDLAIRHPSFDVGETYKYLHKGGSFTFKVMFGAIEDEYYGSEAEFTGTVTVKDLPKTSIEAKEGATVTLNINKDRSYDYAGLKQAMLEQILAINGLPEGVEIKAEDLHFMYVIYNDGAAIKDYIEFDERQHAGDKDEILYHYLHQGGTFDFWVELANTSDYYGSEVYFKANVEINDDYTTKIALKDNYQKNFTLYYNDDQSFDYDRLHRELFDAIIDTANSSANVTFENTVVTYDVTDGMLIHYPDSPLNTVGSDVSDPDETLFTYLHEGGTFTVKFAVPNSGGLFGNSVSVKLNIKPFDRVKTSIVLNGNAEMDYVADPAAIKQYIFDNVISKELSVLPEGVTVNDFTFEYWARNYTAGGVAGVEERWVPFEGMKHPTLAGSYFKPIGAGDHYFRVYYNGNAEYAPSDWTSGNEMISLPKPEFTVDRLSQSYIYRGDALPENFIQCSANTEGADINYRLLFTTTTNSGTALVYLQSRDGYDKGDFIWDLQNEVIINVFHGAKTGDSILRDGLTIDEYKQLIESPELFAYFQKWYDMDAADMATFKTVAYSRLGGMSRVEFRLGTPRHAAHYDLFVGAYNENFETAVRHTGFDVKYNSKGNKLIWREDTSGLNTINSKNFDFGADVTVDGTSQSDGNVKYLYTGFFYCSSNAPRGKAGWFIQTAWTKAGTTYCFPQTRSFTISVL